MRLKTFSFSIVLLVLVASALTISAQEAKSWSTAGSTGTANRVNLNKIIYTNAIVSFPDLPGTQLRRPTAQLPLQTTQAVIRYNVTATEGLFFASGRHCMVARFRDDGNRARVILRLMQLQQDSEIATTLLTFDSNSFPSQAGFQVNSVATNRIPFDFAHNAYYVEATLTKQHPLTSPFGGGKPALALVALSKCTF